MMDQKARIFENYVRDGMTTENMMRSLELIGAPIYDEESDELEKSEIEGIVLPRANEMLSPVYEKIHNDAGFLCREGSFEIIKKLDNWHKTQGSAGFIYEVTAVYDGKTILDNVYGISFTEAGEKKITIGPLPEGSTVTVAETYDGASYKLVSLSEKTQTTVIKADGTGTDGKTIINSDPVTFENTYDEGTTPSHIILNKYTAQKGADGTFSGTWEAMQVEDSTELAKEIKSVS